METFVIFDKNQIIIDVVITDNFCPPKDFYFKKIPNCLNDYSWRVGQNLFDEYELAVAKKIEELTFEIKLLQSKNDSYENRLEIIENLITHELLFSPTFGKDMNSLDVYYKC